MRKRTRGSVTAPGVDRFEHVNKFCKHHSVLRLEQNPITFSFSWLSPSQTISISVRNITHVRHFLKWLPRVFFKLNFIWFCVSWKELAETVRIRTHNWTILGSNVAALTNSFKGFHSGIRKINTHTIYILQTQKM